MIFAEDFVLSQHAKEQMDLRGISLADVELTVREPADETKEANGLTVFQRLFSNAEGQQYLLRVFVNKEADPAKIVTAYKTSKILKYGSEIR